jgi:hypothetical protein
MRSDSPGYYRCSVERREWRGSAFAGQTVFAATGLLSMGTACPVIAKWTSGTTEPCYQLELACFH